MTASQPVEPLRCPRCDHLQGAYAAGCESCGLALVCDACGVAYPDPLHDRFCVACGRTISPSRSEPEPAPSGEHVARASGTALMSQARPLLDRLAHLGRLGAAEESRRDALARSFVSSAHRVLRRFKPSTVAELYLHLGAGLAREQRFEEAIEAFSRALDEDEQLRSDVLRDMFDAAARAQIADVAVQSGLQLALAEPDQAARTIKRAGALLDRDVARAHGEWILKTFPRELRASASPEGIAESALLAARVAVRCGDAETAVDLCKQAAGAEPDVTRAGGRRVLQDARAELSDVDGAAGAWALARMSAALGLVQDALFHVDEVLAQAPAGSQPEAELPVLELKAKLLERNDPKDAAVTLLALGRDLDALTRHHEAVRVFERAAALSEANAEVLWYLADSRRMVGRRDEWPFADERATSQAYADWLAGMRLALPDVEHAWVHLCGALLIEMGARRADERGDWIWSATLQAEQAAALDPEGADTLALVAHFHRMLDHPETARLAADAANASRPASPAILAEQLDAHLATHSDRLDEVIDAVARVPELRSRGLVVRGWRSLALGDHRDAIGAFTAALALEPAAHGVRVGRAIAAALAGDEAQAAADVAALPWRSIPEIPTANSPEMGVLRGLSALVDGDGETAAATLSPLVGSYWVDGAVVHAGLAAGELLRGRHDAALAQLDELLACARDPQQAGVAQALLALAAVRCGGELHEDLRDRLERVKATVRELRPGVPGAELELEPDAADEGIRSVVARAALARLLAADGQHERAAELYESLVDRDDILVGLPAAPTALVRVVRAASSAAVRAGDAERVRSLQERLVGFGASNAAVAAMAITDAELRAGRVDGAVAELERLLALADGVAAVDLHRARLRRGDLLLRAGRRAQARAAYEEALTGAGRTDAGRVLRAEAQARLGVVAAADGDLAEASAALVRALAEASRAAVRAGDTVVAACDEAVDAIAEPPALGPVLRALTEDPAIDEPVRMELRAARCAVLRRAPARTALPSEPHLLIEFDGRIFPQGANTPAAEHLVEVALPALRDRVLAATGVRTPGVVVRTSQLVGAQGYRLLLGGIPYAGGRVAPDRMLCVDADAQRSLRSEDPPVLDPWDGTRGTWLSGIALAEARARGLELLGPMDAVVWHLGGLVRLHLADFVGLTDIQHGLDELEAAGNAPALAGDLRSRVRLTAVVRRLVREQVDVADLGAIVDAVASAPEDEGVIACVDRVRARLSRALPGVHGGRLELALSSAIETAIAAADGSIEDPGLRAACIERVGGRAPGCFVIAVRDARNRRAVQSAFDRLMPTVAVVANEDLPGGRRARRRRNRQRSMAEAGV